MELFSPARTPILFAMQVMPPSLLPFVRSLHHFLSKFTYDPKERLTGDMSRVVDERKQSKTATNTSDVDFIDLFLEAEADMDGWEKGNFDMKQQLKVERKLTVEEIKSSCFLFLVAGSKSFT